MISNPILKSFKNFNLYLLIWLLLAFVQILIFNFILEINFQLATTDALVFNLLLCGLGLSFWYSTRYVSFESYNVSKIILSHIIGGFFSAVIWLALGYYIITSVFGFGTEFSLFFLNTLPWRFLIGLLFYFLITSFYYVIIYYQGFQERTTKEVELKNLVTEAELKSLKFQINPHFIFNSLNSMSALTTIDPEKAKGMILKLADFLRYTLANNEKEKNKLSEELKNIRLYLEIEKIRFEDKFEFFEEHEEGCSDVMVPNMILQPLFENAIKHAVYETLDKVTLNMKCKKENGFLRISLENNFDGSFSSGKGTGVGLNNIRNRLNLIYHQDNLLKVEKGENRFKVDLFIPLN